MAAVIDRAPDAPAGDPWHALAQALTADALCRSWLEVLCRDLAEAEAGLLLMAQADGAYAPVAAYPAERDLSHLREIATEALRQRDAAVRRDDLGRVEIAFPLLNGEQLQGAIVLALGTVPQARVDQVVKLVNWGAGWLIGLLHQRDLAAQRQHLRQGSFLLDTLLGLLAERSPREAALAVVNRLGREFDSPQVLLALARGQTLQLLALSHAAWFDEKAGLLRQATQAMHEAMDQRQRIVWPPADGAASALVTSAHRRYAEEAGATALVSLPLLHDGQVAGVLMLERRSALAAADIDYLDSVAVGLAPALMLQREAHEGTLARARRTAR
ncbi:MAG: GAF domain-containing protein, partial [Burkholderiaceae bacterium]|nr:GAF domain-containing protein [Burkholderiaceae bacterium]